MVELEETARAYREFAAVHAAGRSEALVEWSWGVASDEEVLRYLLTLPKAKRQPNLFFAAVRWHGGELNGWPDFRRRFFDNVDAVRETMLVRSTQTNEPARCATLLPLLARLQQPLALLEVGASAGLCLLPDRYGYDYGGGVLRPETGNPPIFSCEVNGAVPAPTEMPQIVWRAGLDLNPIDLFDKDATDWLEILVWPGNEVRLANLPRAMAVAREDPPRVVRGDLRHDLVALAREAPRDATLVVFHTAVLMYVASMDERREFVDTAMSLGGHWISNEAPGVSPGIDDIGVASPGQLLLALDGKPVAWTHPHGESMSPIDMSSK